MAAPEVTTQPLRLASGVAAAAVSVAAAVAFSAADEPSLCAWPFGPDLPQLKLTYFDIEGAAEKVRLAFVLGGVPFEDERISFDQWAALKPSAKFGQLPILAVDGAVVAQSNAMLLYAGKLGGLYPSDPRAALKVDEVIGLVDDVGRALRPSLMAGRDPSLTEAQKKAKVAALRAELLKEDLPKLLAAFEAILAAEGGYMVGDTPTVADCAALPLLRWLSKGVLDGIPTSVLDKYKRLTCYKQQMEGLPIVASWLVGHLKKR